VKGNEFIEKCQGDFIAGAHRPEPLAMNRNSLKVKGDDLVKSHQERWPSKKLQMQGAQILRNEAYLKGTPQ